MKRRLLETAIAHHTAGRLHDAETIYRQILQQQPNDPDALHLLGVLAYQVRQHATAERLIRRAIELKPDEAAFYTHLGSVLLELDRADESADAHRRAIAIDARLTEAHSNLGNALRRLGRDEEAIQAYRAALTINPRFADAQCNLGVSLSSVGRADEALQAYRTAVELNPRFPQALSNLANALLGRGEIDQAIETCRRLVDVAPDSAEAHHRLGTALARRSRMNEAAGAFAGAIDRDAGLVEAWNDLAVVLHRLGRHADAERAFAEAIARRPGYFEAMVNRANLLRDLRRREEAVEALQAALKVRPDSPEVYNNLGVVYHDMYRMGDAVEAYRRCIELRPEMPEARNNLGNALMKQGLVEEAMESLREAIRLRPDYAGAESNLLYAMHLRETVSPEELFDAHLRWTQRHAEPLARRSKPHANDRTPGRKLRIGYVSADLRDHPVGRFLIPLLEHRDRERFDVTCYSSVAAPDATSQQIASLCDTWRNVAGVPDEALAELIRADRIDILIDLGGHTAGHRLLVFARKAAPVQVSYLGYPDTTGLRAIEYRITDRLADPDGAVEGRYVEKLIRLGQSLLCYGRATEVAAPGKPRVALNGFVTFGSFNNFAKVSPRAMSAWSKLLEAVPGARLMIKALALNDEASRQVAREMLARHGLPLDRVDLVAPEGAFADHLLAYRKADVALDTFPYAGTTTTCEALDMGVPVVTLAGNSHAGRMGVSILATAGRSDWIARDEGQYVAIAARLAADTEGLIRLRATLGRSFRESPLCDASRLARQFEAALRHAWHRWCDEEPASANQWVDRGNAMHSAGDFAGAERAYRAAIEITPQLVRAHSNLGVALASQQRLADAAESYRVALSLEPDVPQTLNNLGNVLALTGASAEAVECLRRAAEISPGSALFYVNLGNALLASGRRSEAVAAFRSALERSPDDLDALNNAATALVEESLAGEALELLDRHLAIKPDAAPVYVNRGNALLAQGRVSEAIDAFERACELDPTNAAAASNRLYAMHLRDGYSRAQIFASHRRWADRYAPPALTSGERHTNDRSPDRRIRVGYVSSDLRDHPVGRLLLPLLEHRDRERFEVFCYAGSIRRDALGDRIAGACDRWRGVAAMSHDDLARLIREDAIDVLVDLSGHTAAHRLGVFSRKPAPVQVTYLGYPDTTGLETIDWRLTDRFADPAGDSDAFHTEKLWRLEQSLICFAPPGDAPAIGAPPAAFNGHATFGSFNNWAKVSPRAMRTWGKLLRAAPGSRLLIKALALGDDATRRIALSALEDAGVPMDRIELLRPTQAHAAHLAAASGVDVALDSFPYAGTTTTVESLWMGLPVVTLSGAAHAARMGASILRTVGFDHWIAQDEAQYITVASELAGDVAKLAEIRASLRDRLLASPLCDAARCARAIEDAYRHMWWRWCDAGA